MSDNNKVRLIEAVAIPILVAACVALVTYIGVLDHNAVARNSEYLVKLTYNLKYVGSFIGVIVSGLAALFSVCALAGSFIDDVKEK